MPYKLTCQTCHKTFESPRKYSKYCSNECRLKALRKPEKTFVGGGVDIKPNHKNTQIKAKPQKHEKPESYGLCLLCKKQFPDSKLYVYKEDSSLQFCEECYRNSFPEVANIIRKTLREKEKKAKFV